MVSLPLIGRYSGYHAWSGLAVRVLFAAAVLAMTWFAVGRELWINTGKGLRLDEGVYVALPVIGLLAISVKRHASHTLAAHLIAYCRTLLVVFSGCMGSIWLFDRTAPGSEFWGLVLIAAIMFSFMLSFAAALVALFLRWIERCRQRALSTTLVLLTPFVLLNGGFISYLLVTQLVSAGTSTPLTELLGALSSPSRQFKANALIFLLSPSAFAVYRFSLRTICWSHPGSS